MDIEANKRKVVEFCDAIGRKDYETVANVFAPDCKVWAAGECWFSGLFDPPGMFKSAERLFALFDDNGFQFILKDMTAEGNRVAIEMESKATHRDGTPYKNKYHFLFVFREDGRIIEYKEYMDTKHAGDVLGVKEPRVK